MTNEQIIAEYESDIGEELHTINGWSYELGCRCLIRRGERGIECRLWKKRKKSKIEEPEEGSEEVINDNFYLAKAYLFKRNQIEIIE